MNYILIITLLVLIFLLVISFDCLKRKRMNEGMDAMTPISKDEMIKRANEEAQSYLANNLNTSEKIDEMNKNLANVLSPIVVNEIANELLNFDSRAYDNVKSSHLPLLSIENLSNLKKLIDKISLFLNDYKGHGLSNYLQFLIIYKMKQSQEKR